jgi:phage baseplate assembly protein W
MNDFIGMSKHTGLAVTDMAHIQQSVADIILTPVGSRVERREYGSELPNLIDAPFNDFTRLKVFAAVVKALVRWEPRIVIQKIDFVAGDMPGKAWLSITASLADGVMIDVNVRVA